MRLLAKRAFKNVKAGQIVDSTDLPAVVVNPDGKPVTLDAEKSLEFHRQNGLVVDAPEEAPRITSLRPATEPTPLAEETPVLAVPSRPRKFWDPVPKKSDPPKED